MNTADTTENTEKKTSALPAKKSPIPRHISCMWSFIRISTVSGACSAEDC